jgi:hypothetical protein
METMLLAAAALSLAVIGTAFAGEGSGPDFSAYNAATAQLRSQAVFGADTTFAGPQIRVQSNVAETGSVYAPQFTGQAALSPEMLSGYAAGGGQG